jgi:transposase
MINQKILTKMRELNEKGFSINHISKETGCDFRTIKKYLANEFKEKTYVSRYREPVVFQFIGYIEKCLEQENEKATTIYRKIKKLGYFGVYDQVKRIVRILKMKIRMKNTEVM